MSYPYSFNTELFKGDDFGAFNQHGLVIEAKDIPEGFTISKAEIKVGPILLTYENPEFPIYWNPTPEVTEQLEYANPCYMAVYDEFGRKRTCQGSFTYFVQEKKV